jgi:CO/xanthine dehydrogenase Mo-binding subunit
VRVLTGKIELGQGIATAVAQVAAEELELDLSQVEVLLAETGRTPDEGYTAGSNSIEASAMSVRYAAAAAREKLLGLAAQKWNVPVSALTTTRGYIRLANGARPASSVEDALSFSEVLGGRQITDEVHEPVTLKPREQYRLVGTPAPRRENIPIVGGRPAYVHDLRFPGMVHARIVRPPGYGATLSRFDESAVRGKFPGLLKIVINGSFLGVVAAHEYDAIEAQQWLRENADWSDGPHLPEIAPGGLPAYLKTLPVAAQKVHATGDVGLLQTNSSLKTEYFKPYLMHGSIGPSCAIAMYDNKKLDIWTHSQGVYPLRQTLAALLHIPPEDIHVKGVAGSGCYGHNGADDAAADAALIALAFPGKHVRLQWSREDEHGWEPYGSAMVMQMEALLDDTGKISHWKHTLWSDTHGTRPGGNPANLLAARYIDHPVSARPSGFSGGANRNAEPYYTIPNQLVEANFFSGPLRTSSLRSLGAYANIFAIESFMEELAVQAGKDPFAFRLLHLEDPRARDVLNRLQAITTNGSPDTYPHPYPATTSSGIGIAFSRYKNSGTYCAVAARVFVDASTREVRVQKMWAVVDAGEAINPDGIKNQIEGGMVQSASWTLYEQVRFDEKKITSLGWSTYPVMRCNQAPELEVVLIDRPDQPAYGAGEAAQGPAAAAIVNAIFHACGKRIRQLPVSQAFA